MGASVRKIDMATPLNAHQSKMAYQDLLNAENAGMPILGMDVEGAPTNLISPELLAQNKNEIPPYLQDYAARIPKIDNTTAPKPTGAKKDPEAEQAKTPAEAAKKEIENTKAAEDKALEKKKKEEKAKQEENPFANLSEDPAKRIGEILGMAVVGGRDYAREYRHAGLKNEQAVTQPGSAAPASKLETKPEAKLASKPKTEDAFMKDMAPAVEAAKTEQKQKRYSNKIEKKIGVNPNAPTKGTLASRWSMPAPGVTG